MRETENQEVKEGISVSQANLEMLMNERGGISRALVDFRIANGECRISFYFDAREGRIKRIGDVNSEEMLHGLIKGYFRIRIDKGVKIRKILRYEYSGKISKYAQHNLEEAVRLYNQGIKSRN